MKEPKMNKVLSLATAFSLFCVVSIPTSSEASLSKCTQAIDWVLAATKCKEEAKEVYKAAKNARKQCAPLRECKKGVRKGKRAIKKGCKGLCANLKRKERKACVKDCKAGAKEYKKEYMTLCKEAFNTKGGPCNSARKELGKTTLNQAGKCAIDIAKYCVK
jgi:hypothetical protein